MDAARADLVLGVDASTTAVKAIVWDRQGRQVAAGRAAIPLHSPAPGGYEQDAGDWWSAARQALAAAAADVPPQRLAALCITHQRETFVVTDRGGRPLRPAIVWMDERCRPQVERVAASADADLVHRLSGKPVCATPSLYKLLWLQEQEPGLLAGDVRVLDVHAYLVQQLTGRWLTSTACADPLGLVELASGDWSPLLLQLAGLQRHQLPEIRPVGSLLGTVTPAAAQTCGLPAGLPVVAGAGDGQAAALGAGISGPARAYLNLGTAVVAGVVAGEPRTGRAFRTLFGAAPDTFLLESDLKGGTFTVDWLVRRWLKGWSAGLPGGEARAEERGQPAEASAAPAVPAPVGAPAPAVPAPAPVGALLAGLEAEARLLPPGAQGLVLLPYWCGVMNPYWDDAASGLVLGWRERHGPAHLFRALLEGIAFEQRLALDGIEQALGSRIAEVVVLGGGADSELWCRILADVLRRRVCRAVSREATSLGAAMLAAWAVGLQPDLAGAAQRMTALDAQLEPGPAADAYDLLYQEVYTPLYPSIGPLMRRLSRLDALAAPAGGAAWAAPCTGPPGAR